MEGSPAAVSACPSDETLAEFVAGRLSSSLELEAHVAECEACHRILATYAHVFVQHRTEDGSEPLDLPRFGRASLPPGTVVGRYVIMTWVGEGAAGVVYAAYDPELDRKVALKLLRPGPNKAEVERVREALSAEARAMAKLAHPHVVAVYDTGAFDGQVFLAMEFVEGPTLRSWLATEKRDWRSILDVFIEAGRGLSAAHAVGLVHRDFKPDNVLLGPDGRARVTDFGLARLSNSTPNTPSLETPRAASEAASARTTPAGTPAYMAPEQMLGEVDARSDQFSFCVALCEALCGERPYYGSHGASSRRREWRDGSPVPRQLRAALERGLSLAPAHRHDSMVALLTDLTRARERRWRNRAAGVLIVIVAFAALILRFGRHDGWAAESVCRGSEKRLSGIWDDDRKKVLSRAFLSTGLPFAADVWQSTERALDAFARNWVAVRKDACEATHVRREQSETILDRRVLCLDRGLMEMRVVTEVLARGDRKALDHAVKAVQDLSPPSQCSALHAGSTAPLEDTSLDEAVARSEALRQTLQLEEAQRVGREALAAAQGNGFTHLAGQASLALGEIALAHRDGPGAEPLLFDAFEAADRARSPKNKARAALELAWALGTMDTKTAEAERWLRLASNAIDEVADDDLLRARLAMGRSGVAAHADRFDDAIREGREAVRILDERLPGSTVQLSGALSNLGCALLPAGQDLEASRAFSRSIDVESATLGPDNPLIAINLADLALVEYGGGRYESARSFVDRAASILAKNAFDPSMAFIVAEISATVLVRLDLRREARAAVQQALSLAPNNPAADKHELAEVHLLLALLAQADRHYSEATREADLAIALNQEGLPAESPQGWDGYAYLGRIYLKADQPAQALQPLKHAARLLATSRPMDRADNALALARALWQTGGDRKEAQRLVDEARAIYREHPKREQEVMDLVEWFRTNAPGVYGVATTER